MKVTELDEVAVCIMQLASPVCLSPATFSQPHQSLDDKCHSRAKLEDIPSFVVCTERCMQECCVSCFASGM